MYLRKPCDCKNYTETGTLTNPRWKRDCFHEPCKIRRLLKATGRWVIQNQAGHVRVAGPDETEELLALRNQQFMARTETCINCHQKISWLQFFSEDCPKADSLRGVGHAFANNVLPYEPMVCGVPDCGETILDGSWQFTVVDNRTVVTCANCCDKFLELTLRGKYEE